MSGSPILQDGRLIGAVTHVSVNHPASGYDLFGNIPTAAPLLHQAHIQQRIGAALLVVIRSLIGLKPQVCVKVNRLGILFVDRDLLSAVA